MSCLRSISLFGDPHHLYPDLRRLLLLIEVIEALSAPSSAFIVGDWVTYSQDASSGFLIYSLTQVLQNGSSQAVQARTLNLQYEVELVFFSPYENYTVLIRSSVLVYLLSINLLVLWYIVIFLFSIVPYFSFKGPVTHAGMSISWTCSWAIRRARELTVPWRGVPTHRVFPYASC